MIAESLAVCRERGAEAERLLYEATKGKESVGAESRMGGTKGERVVVHSKEDASAIKIQVN